MARPCHTTQDVTHHIGFEHDGAVYDEAQNQLSNVCLSRSCARPTQIRHCPVNPAIAHGILAKSNSNNLINPQPRDRAPNESCIYLCAWTLSSASAKRPPTLSPFHAACDDSVCTITITNTILPCPLISPLYNSILPCGPLLREYLRIQS